MKRGRDRLESVVPTDLNSESQKTVAPPPRRAGRLFRRRLVGLVVLGLLGTASMLIADAMSASEGSSRMTYKVTRGELVVSVIEKGTLESSNNTEIKCKVRGFNTVTQIVPDGTFVNVGDELVRLEMIDATGARIFPIEEAENWISLFEREADVNSPTLRSETLRVGFAMHRMNGMYAREVRDFFKRHL